MSASTPVLGVDANAQMNELSDVPHAYYVKAGTETWNKLTVNERIEVSCVEIEECQNMTTRALVQTVLEYPYIIDIFAYPKERGVEVVASWFPALSELLQREDALNRLQLHYAVTVTVEKESDSITILYAERLMEYLQTKKQKSVDESTEPQELRASGPRTPSGDYVDYEIYSSYEELDARTTEADADALMSVMMETYPSTVLVSQKTYKYNCHSYAWHSQNVSTNKYWIFSAYPYIEDESYVETTRKDDAKITYKNYSNSAPSNNAVIDHSGIVFEAGSTLATTTVISKWDYLGLFRHDLMDCPYYGKTGGLEDGYPGITIIEYWELEE